MAINTYLSIPETGNITFTDCNITSKITNKLMNGESVIISRQYVPVLKKKLGM